MNFSFGIFIPTFFYLGQPIMFITFAIGIFVE